ncbi:MAG: SHOCT domain-containing protein [Pseudomonadota bacterium]
MSIMSDLNLLQSLYEEGTIDDEQFDLARDKLLSDHAADRHFYKWRLWYFMEHAVSQVVVLFAAAVFAGGFALLLFGSMTAVYTAIAMVATVGLAASFSRSADG